MAMGVHFARPEVCAGTPSEFSRSAFTVMSFTTLAQAAVGSTVMSSAVRAPLTKRWNQYSSSMLLISKGLLAVPSPLGCASSMVAMTALIFTSFLGITKVIEGVKALPSMISISSGRSCQDQKI